MNERHESVEGNSDKVVRSVLSSGVHESKSVQKQHVKMELENRPLLWEVSSFPSSRSFALVHTQNEHIEIMKNRIFRIKMKLKGKQDRVE